MMSIAVSLALRNQAVLRDTIQRVSDPHSPMRGHYLTPEQFTATYGPTEQQARQTADYLRGRGLNVTAISRRIGSPG